LWVALVTPFQNGRCDLDSTRRLAAHLHSRGVDGVLVGGTTGEGALLSADERILMVGAVAEIFGDRVVAGAFGATATEVAASTSDLRAAGARAIAVLPPPYVSLTATQMYDHYAAIAGASQLPVVLYNFLGQTPSAIPTDVTLALADHPGIIATKQSRPALDADFVQLISSAPPGFPVLVGNPLLMLSAASIGASGAILALANVEPDRLVTLWRSIAQDDYASARTQLRELLAVLLANQGRGPAFKDVLHEQGLIASPARRDPLGVPASKALATTATGAMGVG
jgi:4-hydroxy-tetrahydrodipicolinate synthase